jgi:STE24 endopeptidase
VTVGREAVRTGEGLAGWALTATLLAAAGLAASVWRPLAPSVGAVVTDLDAFDPAVLDAVVAYRSPKLLAAHLATVLGVAVPLAVVLSDRGRAVVRRLAGGAERSPMRAALVGAVISLAVSTTVLPLAAWSRVVHDGRWGFRTQTPLSWWRDWLVVSTGRWLAVAVLSAVLVAAIARWPRSWPYRLTVLGTTLAALLVLAHPIVLQPVLLPTTAFPDGAHRAAIEPVLAAAGDPELSLVLGEASRRSTRVNALVTGLGPTTRIVVYDTLLELPPDQVATVVAHELAHHQHRDLPRGILLTATALLPSLLLLRRLGDHHRVAAGMRSRDPADPRLVPVVLALAAVLELVGQPAANLVSRRLEAAADLRAMELTSDPETQIRATRVFTVRDLSTPEPSRWVTVLYRTHPSVGERIRRAVELAERWELELPSRDELESSERDQRHPAADAGPP